jgi:tetratricopeptide (TPR) repeat protein
MWPTVFLVLTACGSSTRSFLAEDEELRQMFNTDEYVSMSDYERYRVAEYLMSKGQVDEARKIYEDIITYNPGVSAIKYKLAMIYLGRDSVSFGSFDEKGRVLQFSRGGKDLGEAVLQEIRSENPGFLPVYSQLMVLNVGRRDSGTVRELFTTARELDKDFNTADYRVGYLTMFDRDNPNAFEDAESLMRKAQRSYRELYESYKNLGNIHRVQKQDTLAYKAFLKALDSKSEAVDLFATYGDMAEMCRRIYQQQQNEIYRDLGLRYACMSLAYFPGYKPSVDVLHALGASGVVEGVVDSSSDSAAVLDRFCSETVSAVDSMRVQATTESVIPRSILRKQMEAAPKTTASAKPRSVNRWVIGGAVVAGAGGAVLLLGSGGGKSSGGFGNPPGFPNPN